MTESGIRRAPQSDRVNRRSGDASTGSLAYALGSNHGTDRVAEVANLREFLGYDAFVNVQGDEPFVSAEAIRGAVAQVVAGKFPLGTAACRSVPRSTQARPALGRLFQTGFAQARLRHAVSAW